MKHFVATLVLTTPDHIDRDTLERVMHMASQMSQSDVLHKIELMALIEISVEEVMKEN